MVTVHSSKRWDISRGDYATLPLKGTIEYIKAIRGQTISSTAEDVPSSAIDEQGRYDPPRL